jgi:predicted Zn-dependent protease
VRLNPTLSRRLAFLLATVFCLSLVVCSDAPVSAKDTWTSVRSKNFLLVGNANEKEIRQVGIRLEQFREVFSRLFTSMKVNSPVPTTVVVFKNDESYRPFKPNAHTAGYFQPGSDVNYITLKLENDSRSEQDPYTIIFHEFTHLLVENTSGNVPTWFNEGLAEYYSTFSITDDQKVVLGKPIANHVYLLRDKKMLPLRTLFQVDHKSPYYNEREKQSIFYAQSWALLHYLMLANNGERMTQLATFVDLLTTGLTTEKAFEQAFATTFESMEKELRAYIQRDRYPIFSGSFSSKVGYETEMQAAPITEAEAQAYLGDLLLHSNRSESEVYLQKALALDPNLAMAHASLGMLRVRQGKSAEARKSLERAVAANSQNYLIHYYYAYALSREGNADMETVMAFTPESAAKMRSELKLAINLRPDFPESYSLLAFVNLVTDTEVDESLEMLKRALAASPGRNDLVFMMAQLYMRKEDFKTARQLIEKLRGDNNEPEMRQRAQSLLAQLVAVEEQLAHIRALKAEQAADSRHNSTQREYSEHDPQKYDPAAALRESLRRPGAGETQAQGMLVRIDCDAKGGITFVVRIGARLLKLRSDSFNQVELITFSENSGGEITCGVRRPENNVVVCYLPASAANPRADGIIKSVEFVPSDFKLKP